MSGSIPKLLVIDDDYSILNFFKRLFKGTSYNVHYYKKSVEAMQHIGRENFDCIITDLKIDNYGGLDILKYAKDKDPLTEVILITGYGTIESAVQAMQLGAYDYLTKPLDVDKTRITIERAIERRNLRNTISVLKKKVDKNNRMGVVAVSESMRRVLDLAEAVAQTSSTVLITGESGVGKEVIARYIHNKSQRADRSFVSINSSAIPESLLESELFGYVEGAFTGAVKNKLGLFEEASGGTLFFDEVGELPFSTQAKLLRALQEGEIRHIGSTRNIKVDVRIIAATNQNLHVLVNDGKFREDLYYRLNVIPINIPPLRERKEDIIPLINMFVDKYSIRMKKFVREFNSDAIYIMMQYDWPGNVRELENIIERIIAICKGENITAEDVHKVFKLDKNIGRDVKIKRIGKTKDTNDYKIDEGARVLNALKETNWNHQKAAERLGISRTTLWRKIKKYGLKQ